MDNIRKRKKEIKEEIQTIDSFEIFEMPAEPQVVETPREFANKTDELRDGFEKERNKWFEKVEDYSSNFKDVRKLIDIQLLIYTDRQNLCDQKSSILSSKIKYDKTIREKRKNIFYKLKTESDIALKYNTEMNMFIEAEMKNDLEKIELLNMHLTFLDDTLRTIDNMIYGIKTRIDMENKF